MSSQLLAPLHLPLSCIAPVSPWLPAALLEAAIVAATLGVCIALRTHHSSALLRVKAPRSAVKPRPHRRSSRRALQVLSSTSSASSTTHSDLHQHRHQQQRVAAKERRFRRPSVSPSHPAHAPPFADYFNTAFASLRAAETFDDHDHNHQPSDSGPWLQTSTDAGHGDRDSSSSRLLGSSTNRPPEPLSDASNQSALAVSASTTTFAPTATSTLPQQPQQQPQQPQQSQQQREGIVRGCRCGRCYARIM